MDLALDAAVMAGAWIGGSLLALWVMGLTRGKAASPGKVYYPHSTLGAALAALAGIGWLAYRLNQDFAPTAWLNGALAAAALLSVLLAVEYALARHEVSERGLHYGSLTGRRGELEWDELGNVRYGTLMKWFVLKTRSGKVARVSAMSKGLPEFARQLLEHTPPEAIDPRALPVLRATAAGNLPSLWR